MKNCKKCSGPVPTTMWGDVIRCKFCGEYNKISRHSCRTWKKYFPYMGCFFLLLLAGCAGDPRFIPEHPAGFFHGLFHGLILPISFFASLFNDGIEIYEKANNGEWYDFGFIFGVSSTFGGTASSSSKSAFRIRRKKKLSNDD